MPNLPAANGGSRPAAVASFIDQLKASRPLPSAAGRGRLIVSLDATASREPTWDQAAHITHAMFDATASLGGLMTQLVFYRGFNECKASRWLTTAAELHRVMAAVRCLAGMTQIARLLDHAIRETEQRKVNALVFIGDAMEEPVNALGRRAGELGRLGVPVFAFHEGNDPTAASAFRQIASLSNGAYLPFDLGSIDRLKQLLAAIAVYATGGMAALTAYSARQGGAVLQITSQLKR